MLDPAPFIQRCLEEQRSDLNLTGFQLTGKEEALQLLKECKQLKSLGLGSNQFQDLSFLGDFPQLEQLMIDRNELSSIEGIERFTQLKELYLPNNQISDLSPLKGLKQLELLDLRNNQLKDIEVLRHLSQLKKVMLRGNQLSSVAPLKELEQLHTMDLAENQLSEFPRWLLDTGWSILWTKAFIYRGINLYNNPIQDVPAELIQKGAKAIREYLKKEGDPAQAPPEEAAAPMSKTGHPVSETEQAGTRFALELKERILFLENYRQAYIERSFPPAWELVSSELEQLSKTQAYITVEDYQEIATKQGVEAEQQKQLLEMLHELGACFFYGETKLAQQLPGFGRRICIAPLWLVEASFVMLADVPGYRVDKAEIEAIWSKPEYKEKYAAESDYLIYLMRNLGLLQAYEQRYIMPPRLPKEPPAYDWSYSDALRLKLHYPAASTPRLWYLMAKHSELLPEDAKIWRYGAIFHLDASTKAEVTTQIVEKEQRIGLRIVGPKREAFLVLLRGSLEEV